MTDHDCQTISQLGRHRVWALCSCGWQSRPYESDKDAEAAHDTHRALEKRREQEAR
jgi:hypothetical protein